MLGINGVVDRSTHHRMSKEDEHSLVLANLWGDANNVVAAVDDIARPEIRRDTTSHARDGATGREAP